MPWALTTIIVSLFLVTVKADNEWQRYNPDKRWPWALGDSFTRDEYHWFIQNTGQESRLFQNGVFVGSESGTNDIGIPSVWAIWPTGVPVGVVDLNSAHAGRVAYLAKLITRNQVLRYNVPRLQPENLASGISNFASWNVKVIVITEGFGSPDERLSNACRYAEVRGSFVFCAAPNSEVNIDAIPDYPSSWASEIVSVVPITATDRNGNLYGPGAAAFGSNVIGAPGRNILCETNYTSGTSAATPIAAGCMAILMQYKRLRSLSEYRQALWDTSDEAIGVRRINPKAMMEALE